MYNSIDKLSALDTLKNIASKFNKDLEKTLLEIFALLKNRLVLAEVLKALEQGGLTSLLYLLSNWEEIIGSKLLLTLQDNIIKSGRFFVGNLPKGSLANEMPYTLFEPGVIQVINNYGARLVMDISDTARNVIVEQLKYNMIAGNNPRKTAIDIRESIGLTVPLYQAVQRYRKALEESDIKMLREMMGDVRNGLRDHRFDQHLQSIIDGKKTSIPQETIDKMVQRYTERLVKYRSETIARTESMRALALSEYESISEAYKKGNINPNLRRFWLHAKDERVRAAHIEIPKLNPKGVGVVEPFNTPLGLLRYPRDIQGLPQNVINCRCTLGYRIIR